VSILSVTTVEQELAAGKRFGYRPEFDGLRGVAILGVILYHYFPNWFRGSIVGVDLFFVLSGFLITRLMLEEKQRYGSISMRDFYAKRFGRLVPGIVFLLLVVVPAGLVRLGTDRGEALFWGAVGGITFTTNWLRIFGVSIDPVLSHLWSTGIEQQFYAVWPIMVVGLGLTVRRLRTASWVIVIAASVNIVVRSFVDDDFRNIFDGLDTHGALMLLSGALLAAVLPSAAVLAKRQRLLTAALVLGLAVRSALVFIPDERRYEEAWGRGGIHLTAVAMMIVIVAVKELGWLQKLLSGKVVCWLGRIAYSLFIWHQPVENIVPLDFVDALWLRNIVFFLISLAAAAASYYVIEQPMRTRIIKRFGDPARRTKAAAAAS